MRGDEDEAGFVENSPLLSRRAETSFLNPHSSTSVYSDSISASSSRGGRTAHRPQTSSASPAISHDFLSSDIIQNAVCLSLSWRCIAVVLTPNVFCSQRGPISGQEEAGRERSSQLGAWLNQDEAHEQLAVGERVSRSEAELKRSLNGVEKKVDGLKKWWKK